MNVAEQLEAGLTYKAGWSFEADGADLVIRLDTVDSLEPDSTLDGIPVRVGLAGLGLGAALEAVHARIVGIEAHESHEWLRLNGLMATRNARRNHPGWPIKSHTASRLIG